MFSQPVFSQSKWTTDADIEFRNGGYNEAANKYKFAYKKEKQLDIQNRILFQLGECYRLMTDYVAAEEWYKKAITAQYFKQDVTVYFNYGEVMRKQGRFDEAIVQYNKYIEKGGDAKEAKEVIAQCEDAAKQLNAPKSRYVVEPETGLNSPGFDFSPTFATKKGDELIFSSSRAGSSVGNRTDPLTGEAFMSLYTVMRDKKGKWSSPTLLPNTVNTESSEGASAFDKNYKELYFTRCINTDKGKKRLGCDIYVAKRSGKNYQTPELIVTINREQDDTSSVGHPTFTADDQIMIFASNMHGGYGGRDLWYMEFDKKSKSWGTPKNLGNTINTSGDEMFPFIAENGTLFFSSNGHPGLGGLDIFKAEKTTGDVVFGKPVNMNFPINSSSDDFGIVFEPGKDQGYFTSNRPGGKGKDDIYAFRMPPLEFRLIATVYDIETGSPISKAKVLVTGTDGSSYELTTDGNGGIALDKGEIKAETNYSVDVSKTGYIGAGDKFTTQGLKESTTFAREYFLEPIKEKEYTMPLVLYPFDKAELLVNNEVNSKDSLNYLYDLMVRNPNFVIQLEAHTDTRGSADYNRNLSQRRAQTCVDYLVSKGIEPDRLKAAGKGKDEPKISDAQIAAMKTEEEREAAHQINRRTVFRILSFDYVSKKK
jgi:peptidoglycan-associated lipoprotein